MPGNSVRISSRDEPVPAVAAVVPAAGAVEAPTCGRGTDISYVGINARFGKFVIMY